MESPRLVIPFEIEPGFRLPEWRTPIIGRDAERADAAHLLTRDDVWLMTITGPGGVGKSRLAHAVARDLTEFFGGNVAWVTLASAQDRDRAIEQLASTLGVATAQMSAEQAISAALRDRHALLVLDNLEQIPDLGPYIASLAETHPDVKFLATSRVPLRLRGEYDLALGPLAKPAVLDQSSRHELRESDAVRLFASRAQAADSSFALTDDNIESVAEICRRLDGLPLAIELAAARIRLLPPKAMIPRLTRSLDLLTAGSRDAPERHKTLRNTIQWSFDLLDHESQSMFRRLAVFSGSFDLDATQAMALDSGEVLDPLAVLLDHSLLMRVDQPVAGRFIMLDTIREFALSSLGTGEEWSNARNRHAAYYASIVRTTVPRPGQHTPWLDEIELEIANIRDALDWLAGQNDAETLLETLNMLSSWWLSRGNLQEGYDWLRKVVQRSDTVTPSVRVDSRLSTAWFATQVGQFEFAQSVIASIDQDELAQQPIGPRVRYFSLQSAWHFFQNDAETAFEMIDSARELAEREGVIAEAPSIRINLAAIATVRGDMETGRRQHELGLRESEAIDVRAIHSEGLANISIKEGDFEEAWSYLQEAWRGARGLGYVQLMVSELASKAELFANTGDLRAAAQLLGAADQLRLTRGWSVFGFVEADYNALFEMIRDRIPDAEYEIFVAEGRLLPQPEIDALMERNPFAEASSRSLQGVVVAKSERGLTPRELEVLQELSQGKTNPEIADTLFISERTVQTHVARILQKLDVPSRSAAAVVAVREGLI